MGNGMKTDPEQQRQTLSSCFLKASLCTSWPKTIRVSVQGFLDSGFSAKSSKALLHECCSAVRNSSSSLSWENPVQSFPRRQPLFVTCPADN